jgi:ribosomal protein L7/L12
MNTDELDPVLIFNSLNFVQAITKNYGAEQGMAMWDTIADTVDRRLKLEVFKAMMNPTQLDGRIRIVGAQPSADKVKLIKTLREYTSQGLKDAKDSVDLLHTGTVLNVQVPYHLHMEAVKAFRIAGFML